MAAEAPATIVQPSEDPKTKSKTSLVVLGVALIALFLAGLVLARAYGTKTVEKSTPSSSTATEVTKTTTAKNLPSDTLLTALLATGAILVFVGLLYTRMSSIKLPGAGEIDFITPTDKEKEQVANKVTEVVNEKKAAGETVTEADAAKVAVDALANLAEQKKQILKGAGAAPVVEAAVETAAADHGWGSTA